MNSRAGSRAWALGAAAALVVLAGATWLNVHVPDGAGDSAARLKLLAVMWLVFVPGAIAVLRSPRRAAIWLILAGGAVLQVVAMTTPAQTSTDYYRYAWDGQVQASGINPYRYVPVAPQLEPLRAEQPWLWPVGRTCPAEGVPQDQACPLMNRPTVNTIYPPVGELYFLAMHKLSPAGMNGLQLQIAAGLCGFGVSLALVLIARTRGGDPRRAVLWAWCPLVIVELGNNAHLDGFASLLVVVALGVLSTQTLARRGAIAGGLLVGLAIAAKLMPAVIMPAVVRRRPISVIFTAAVTTAVVYVPYVLGVGSGVSGFLSGYVDEEKSGQFAIFKLFMQGLTEEQQQRVSVLIGLPLVAGLALWTMWRSDARRPWLGAATMVGGTLIITTPTYPWYALLLVPLVALGARASWLLLAPAMSLSYLGGPAGIDFTPLKALAFLFAAAIVAGFSLGDYADEQFKAQAGAIEPGAPIAPVNEDARQ